MPAVSVVHPGPGNRRAEEHRVHLSRTGLLGQLAAYSLGGHRPLGEVAGQQPVVMVGQRLHYLGGRAGVRHKGRVLRAEVAYGPHGHHVDAELGCDLSQQHLRSGAAAVDLVDEDQHWKSEPAQRPHQYPSLRLHPLHRGHHEHHAVEDVEHPFHLGDEVGVARRVDEVDDRAVDLERDHRGLDRDAAAALQRKGVSLGVAVVDPADVVDDPGRVEQPFGERGLTGVDVRQDPQVERVQVSYPRCRSIGWVREVGASGDRLLTG